MLEEIEKNELFELLNDVFSYKCMYRLNNIQSHCFKIKDSALSLNVTGIYDDNNSELKNVPDHYKYFTVDQRDLNIEYDEIFSRSCVELYVNYLGEPFFKIIKYEYIHYYKSKTVMIITYLRGNVCENIRYVYNKTSYFNTDDFIISNTIEYIKHVINTERFKLKKSARF